MYIYDPRTDSFMNSPTKETTATISVNTSPTYTVRNIAEVSDESIEKIADAVVRKLEDRKTEPQSERQNRRIFQEIIVEYPSISTYSEYEGKPYFSIKYMEDGQGYIGYGTYKPEVLSEYLRKYFLPSADRPQGEWIPCSERLPKIGEYHISEPCLVYCKNGAYTFTELEENIFGQVGWNCERDDDYHEPIGEVVAWMPLPKPWKGADDD